MDKIFLSHSSVDKAYVEPIANKLGRDLCIYDTMCFEEGVQTLNEIIEGMNSTSLFVFFISDTSLNSDWVKRELVEAENKIWITDSRIKQFFPIIIDPSITYEDKRIPSFLKDKFKAYNICHIPNSRIAYRKILSQYNRLRIESGYKAKMEYSQSLFYGRHQEIYRFQEEFENGQCAKCLVVSGIQGIGKRSFIVNALRQTGIIKEYYEPAVISMKSDDGIVDLIMRLSEIGFGNYDLEQIVSTRTMDDKISCLKNALSEVQNWKEHVIIYDDRSLIGYDGEVKYWLDKAIDGIRGEMTFSVASTVALGNRFLSKHKSYIGMNLTTLRQPEWKGLFREYGKQIGIEIDADDSDYFSGVLTGYPPQVLYCADYIKDVGMKNAKNSANQIVASVSDDIASILNLAFDTIKSRDYVNKGKGFLSFLSGYGIMPMSVLMDVLSLDKEYGDFLNRYKALTICRLIGSQKDYLEVNPAIADYVQRNFRDENRDIANYLEKKYQEFVNNIERAVEEDFESLKNYLKRAVKDGNTSTNLLYSSIYLSAVRELYDSRKYKQVIEIVLNLKEKESFERFEIDIQEQLQRYLCRALARQMDSRFEREIEWYRAKPADGDRYSNQYHFLLGFKNRLIGNYRIAAEEFQKVLGKSPNHKATRRELVATCLGMEEYETCRSYARQNYNLDPSNKYYIQAYFDTLIHSESISNEKENIDNVMDALDKVYRLDENKDGIYYVIKAKYYFFVNNDKKKAIETIKMGEEYDVDSPFLLIAEFDFYEELNDREGMQEALNKLSKLLEKSDGKQTKVAFRRRQIIYNAYCGVDKRVLETEIEGIREISDKAKANLNNKISRIIAKRR